MITMYVLFKPYFTVMSLYFVHRNGTSNFTGKTVDWWGI